MASRKPPNQKPKSVALIAAAKACLRSARQNFERPQVRLTALGAAGFVGLLVLGLAFHTTGGPDGSIAIPGEADRPSLLPATGSPTDSPTDSRIGMATTPGETSEPNPDIPDATPSNAGVSSADATGIPDEPAPLHRSWTHVQVASGDTMEMIFRRLGLSPRLLHEVVNLDEHSRSLVDLRPGDEISFEVDPDGGFRALRAEFGDDHWLFVERADDALTSRLEPRLLETRIVEVEAEITSSLFNAGKNAGLSDNMILRLATIFGWDIDFALDIRRGDRFALVYEEIYRDDQFLRQGSILAARFVNQGKPFEAIRFDAGNGPDYFDPEGRPMRKAFLRAPLNFTRVTSNFNPRRFHPVTRRVRPHNGTDYGAATGTPVWAAGDGKVIEAGYGQANGNYIFIQHGNHIVTRYLHLSRKAVKRGDRVRQGQTIGAVGATGLATGPHLHYEFLVNGAHRDPRKVDLPEATPLPADKLPVFRAHAEPILAKLEELMPPRVLLASAGGRCSDDRDGCPASSE